jgi:nitrite reductase (NADH) small subunit
MSAVLQSNQQWVDVCAVNDIPVLGSRVIEREYGGNIAVFRASDDTVFALLDACPHKGGPLSQGIVFGRAVSCPLHQWTIALTDGQAHAPDQGCAASFTVLVKAERVFLDSNQVRTLGV